MNRTKEEDISSDDDLETNAVESHHRYCISSVTFPFHKLSE